MLAEATAELLRRRHLIPGRGGIYHLSADGHTSRYEFAKSIICVMREIPGTGEGWASVTPVASDQYAPLPAKRPHNTVTSKERVKKAFGVEIPHWERQLENFLQQFAGSSARRSA